MLLGIVAVMALIVAMSAMPAMAAKAPPGAAGSCGSKSEQDGFETTNNGKKPFKVHVCPNPFIPPAE